MRPYLFSLFLLCGFLPVYGELLDRIGSYIVVSPTESYELVSFLGEGKRSEVFLARDARGHDVAMKRMKTKEQLALLYPSDILETMFSEDGTSLIALKELTISQKFPLPYVIQVYELFLNKDIDGYLHTYLIMDFVNGTSIAKTLPQTLSKEKGFDNFLQIIDVLESGLTQNLIHKDLSYHHIMLDHEQNIKFVDLDSFEECLDHIPTCLKKVTHEEYLQKLISLLIQTLSCANFSNQELKSLESQMSRIYHFEEYQKNLKTHLNPSSISLLLKFLNDIRQVHL